MPLQKCKEKEKQTVTKSKSKLSVFERNEPSTSSHMITHSPDLQNDLKDSPEIIQPEETSNYNHHGNITNENNGECIKN